VTRTSSGTAAACGCHRWSRRADTAAAWEASVRCRMLRSSAPALPRATTARALRRTLPSLNPCTIGRRQIQRRTRMTGVTRNLPPTNAASVPAPACGVTDHRLPHTQPPCMAVRRRPVVQLVPPGLRRCCTRWHSSIATCRGWPSTASGKRRYLASHAAGGTNLHHKSQSRHLSPFVSGNSCRDRALMPAHTTTTNC